MIAIEKKTAKVSGKLFRWGCDVCGRAGVWLSDEGKATANGAEHAKLHGAAL